MSEVQTESRTESKIVVSPQYPVPVRVTCLVWPTLVLYRGTAKGFRLHMCEDDRPEKIAASANKVWLDGEIHLFVGYPKARHHHLIRLMVEQFGEDYDIKFAYPNNQGFLTSHGRYVGRSEARKIAEAQNQLVEGALKHRHLFSEDVWRT